MHKSLYQLTVINNWVFTSFDNELEIRSVFLDLFKAFGKIWHKEHTFKLKQNCTACQLLHILSDFSSN